MDTKKIWKVVSILSIVGGALDALERMLRWLAMFDMRIFLEICIFVIFTVSTSMYFWEKHKEKEKQKSNELSEIKKEIKGVSDNAYENHKAVLTRIKVLEDRVLKS